MKSINRPQARPSIEDPLLARPAWTTGKPRDPKLLWLDKNEAVDPELASAVTRILQSVPSTAISTYPECAPLYLKLAAHLGIAPESVLLTTGADGVIRAVFEAYVEPGDVVLHTQPTFAMYPVYCRMFGAKVMPIVYAASDSGPVLSSQAIIDAIIQAKPKLICLPNPDSPTGTVIPPRELRNIVDAAGKAGSLILLDEAYHPYHDWTAQPWLSECPQLVIARTFSKAWGLAGMRIGYALACPELAKVLHKVRPLYEVNGVAVAMMERLLDQPALMFDSVRRLNAGRDRFITEMEALGLRTIRAKGNFLHVAFGDKAPAVHAALKDLVLYRADSTDVCLKGFTRFSATTSELFEPVIKRIKVVFAEAK